MTRRRRVPKRAPYGAPPCPTCRAARVWRRDDDTGERVVWCPACHDRAMLAERARAEADLRRQAPPAERAEIGPHGPCEKPGCRLRRFSAASRYCLLHRWSIRANPDAPRRQRITRTPHLRAPRGPEKLASILPRALRALDLPDLTDPAVRSTWGEIVS